MTITKIEINKSISDLDAWGRFSDLGAEILEGDVLAYGKMTYGAPTDPINAAYFGTTKGKFRLVYPFSEQATLIRGEIILTDETTGQSKHYKSGDSWFVTKGTPTLWEIITENFTKHYLAFA